CHQSVVYVDVDRLTDFAVELEHGAGAEAQELADIHAGTPQHRRDLHRNIEHGLEIGGRAAVIGLFDEHRRVVAPGMHGHIAVEVGQRYFRVLVPHASLHRDSGSAVAAVGHVTGDGIVDRSFGAGAVALDPAVGPFDAAVAGRDIGLGQHHQPAFE